MQGSGPVSKARKSKVAVHFCLLQAISSKVWGAQMFSGRTCVHTRLIRAVCTPLSSGNPALHVDMT